MQKSRRFVFPFGATARWGQLRKAWRLTNGIETRRKKVKRVLVPEPSHANEFGRIRSRFFCL